LGGFFAGKTAPKAKFDDTALLLIDAGETREGVVKSDDLGPSGLGEDERFFENNGAVGAALGGAMIAGIVNEHLAHETSRDGDKVSVVLGVDGPRINETEVGFMDKGSASKSVIGASSLEEAVSEVVEFVVDQGSQSLGGFRIPLSPADEKFRNGLGCHANRPGKLVRTGWSKLRRRLAVSQCNESAGADIRFAVGRPKEQKLILAQLAEEEIVNPNSKAVVEELINEGLLKRSHGMLEVFSSGSGFARFVNMQFPAKRFKPGKKRARDHEGPHYARRCSSRE
jgi:hypothetical protein